MDKFEKLVKPGGTLIYDPNGITHHPTRKDINIYQIEGARLAAEGGNPKIFNMIILLLNTSKVNLIPHFCTKSFQQWK